MCYVVYVWATVDEPQDGPQHYILLLGFYQPQLIGALDAIGVHVANVIKLCSEHTSEGQQQEQHPCEADEQSRRPSLALDAGKGPSVCGASKQCNSFYMYSNSPA